MTSPSRMDRHIEMMTAVEKALIQAKCLVQPVVCIHSDVDKGLVGTYRPTSSKESDETR